MSKQKLQSDNLFTRTCSRIGRIKPRKDLPIICSILRNERLNLFVAVSEYVSMLRETELPQTALSYFHNDIFGDGNEKFVIRSVEPVTFFIQALQEISKTHKGIVRFDERYENGKTELHVFLKEPNWELEELIYGEYGKLLDEFPSHSLDLKVTDLCGKV